MPWMRRPFNDPVRSGIPDDAGHPSDVSDVSADRRFPLRRLARQLPRPASHRRRHSTAVTSTVTMLTARAPMLIHSAAHAGSRPSSPLRQTVMPRGASGRTLTCSVGRGRSPSPRAPPCLKRYSNGP